MVLIFILTVIAAMLWMKAREIDRNKPKDEHGHQSGHGGGH